MIPLHMGACGCVIVVPCYNEEQRFPVSQFQMFLSAPPADVHFLFVNDGSRDGTLTVLRRLEAEFPALVSVLDQSRNMGKAEAVRSGMLAAIAKGTSITGFWDADLATPLAEIPRLLTVLGDRPLVEMLLGSRVRLLGNSVHRKTFRHYSGRVFATLASLTLRLPVYDTQCGAKFFRVNYSLREMLEQPFISRWIFDVELLARYLVIRRRQSTEWDNTSPGIHEEPLHTWHDVDGSKLKPSDSIKAIGELYAIHRRYFAK